METPRSIHESLPTIGFLTANIHIGASRSLWRGVLDAAQVHQANLICYPGGRLNSGEDFEAERNVIFGLLNPAHLDGLVSWTSALAGAATSDEVIAFHRRYDPLPIVSLATPLGHSPVITINGYQGMQELVFHLVDVHHYHRIALIRGPEGHPYALERYHAYLDALAQKGLDADPALIAPTTSWEKGAEAMSVLLDERQLNPGVDFQAVVAVSDLLAIGALSRLAERGIRVPSDVAVVGFNDIEEGRLIRPALTSVSLPFYEQGSRSVEVLFARLEGLDVTEHVTLDSHLLVRQSCGCPSHSVQLAAAHQSDREARDTKATIPYIQEQLVDQIARVISNRGVAATWAKQLVDAFSREIQGGAPGQFRATLDGMLQQGVLDGDETTAWQSAISVFRRERLPTLDQSAQRHAENLFSQARVVIGEAIQRAQVARQLQDEHQNQALRQIGQALITTFDMDGLCDVLAERLPDLGIDSCYLALYEEPHSPTEGASRLVLAYSDGRRTALGPDGERFPSQHLLPARFLPRRRYSLLVEPLYFQTEPIGYAIFEVGPQDGDIYEVLRGHISTALKGALLFREARDARLAAERADQIKTRLLANVSHELRTPLNIIVGHAERLLGSAPLEMAEDLADIQLSAEHQLRIINDLLDLSRAEINALDLYPVPLDPMTLIEDAFAAMAKDVSASNHVAWKLVLPESLPTMEADPVRLRQIILNLLSNSARFTEQGEVTLGAEATLTHLHLWVADTGSGIPPDIRERIYEPFFSQDSSNQRPTGIGLGLSITRHLVGLHGGILTLESEPDQGSTFHVYLPLPAASDHAEQVTQPGRGALWLISHADTPPEAIADFTERQGLTLYWLGPDEDIEALLSGGLPAAVAWDSSGRHADDWLLIRRLHNHPQLSQTPFILYQGADEAEGAIGLTSLVVKPASSEALWEAIRPAVPRGGAGSVLIIDDDRHARQLAGEAVGKGLPEYEVRMAENGQAGLSAILAAPPDLVILDLMMPEMDGFEVLEHMRADERAQQVPVVILSGRQLSLDDVQRLERHAGVTLQSKAILSEDEIVATLHRTLSGMDVVPPQTGALAKRALAYLHQHFDHPLTREEIATGVGVHEDYLTRVFNREIGISPWDYLNRYRIFRAKELLVQTDKSIGQIARRVGFSDPAYFSRVFRKLTGSSPSRYRKDPVD